MVLKGMAEKKRVKLTLSLRAIQPTLIKRIMTKQLETTNNDRHEHITDSKTEIEET